MESHQTDKKIKIGILTFHRAKNFGAALQCYALSCFLSHHGFDVRVIDYRPDYLAGGPKDGIIKQIRITIRFILYWTLSKGEVKHKDGFEHFIKKFLPLCDFDRKEEMDSYICGSDQIWSTTICKKIDPIFFAHFPLSEKKLKISYAASMGQTALTSEQRQTVQSYLSEFKAISVREESLKEYFEEMDISCTQVLDPVLLVNRTILERLIVPIHYKRPFVLVYEIVHLENTIPFAQHIAYQLNADVIVIGGGIVKCFTKGIINKLINTPEQFVSYFKHASCVVTTSFHGTAFALQFEKTFYCLKMNSYKDDRILSLLKSVGLLSQSVDSTHRINYEPIDYMETRKRLAHLRTISATFLLSALN